MRKKAKRWGTTGAGGALLLALSTQAGTEPTALTGDALAALQAAAEQAADRWHTSPTPDAPPLGEVVLKAYGESDVTLGHARVRALAEGGDTAALMWLGVAVSDGVGEAPNPVRGQALIEQSADQGYARAQLTAAYGHRWEDWGNGDEDKDKWLHYLEAAAWGGDPQAQYHVGETLMVSPQASRESLFEALEWLDESAAQGCARAGWRAAQVFERLMDDASTNAVVNAYSQAASLGSARAAHALSTRLREIGRKEEAQHWLEVAAHRGLAAAQRYRGVELLRKGKAVEGVAWAKRAAHQGDGPAQVLLGELFATGKGVALDQSRGYLWLLLATASEQSDPATQRAMTQTPLWLQWARVWLSPEEARAVEAEAAGWTPKAERVQVPCVRTHESSMSPGGQ